MTTQANTLRPFTKQDWDCFAGASSDAPEIAEITKGSFDGVLILDGEHIQVIENGQDGFFFKDCSSPSCARLVALAILSSEQPLILAAELLEEAE